LKNGSSSQLLIAAKTTAAFIPEIESVGRLFGHKFEIIFDHQKLIRTTISVLTMLV